MGVDIILRIAAIGILTAVITAVLKHAGKDEMATFATLAGVVICLLMVINLISDLFGTVQNLFGLY